MEDQENNAKPEKKTFSIFVFGKEDAGKSTIVASIFHYLKSREDILFHPDYSNAYGAQTLVKWLECLGQDSFPEHYEPEIFDFEVSLDLLSSGEEYNLEFLIAPDWIIQDGEFSSVIPDELQGKIKTRLMGADLLLLITDTAPEVKEDFLISSFLNSTLKLMDFNIPSIFITSKWDQVDSSVDSPEQFLKTRLPISYKNFQYSLHNAKKKILKFSAGAVSDFKKHGNYGARKVEFNEQDARVIFDTIQEFLFQPKKPKGKKNSYLEKLEHYLAQLETEPDNIETCRKVKGLYLEIGEPQKAREIDERICRLVEAQAFVANLGKKIRLQQLELRNLDFFGDFKWNFHPRINILLGRNGYGKSHLLRLMAALLQKDDQQSGEFLEEGGKDSTATLQVLREKEQFLIARNKFVFDESIGKVAFLAIPDIRLLDKSRALFGPSEDDEYTDVVKHGAHHFLYQKTYDNIIRNFLYQLCITYLDKGKRFDVPIFQMVEKIVGKLSGQEFRFHDIQAVGNARFKIDVITEGNKNPLPIQYASQGTLSVLAILGLIRGYLRAVFPAVPDEEVANQPGLVFIDEVDAHLHPSWQQKLVGILRDTFPGVQFLLTAHSPLVVAGCREGEAAVLRKTNHGFAVRHFNRDFIGCRARELYETLFDIEDTDEAFLYYNALYPFIGEMETKIETLEKKKKETPLSTGESRELDKLYDDVYYSRKANDTHHERREFSRLIRENRRLKARLEELEGQKIAERGTKYGSD